MAILARFLARMVDLVASGAILALVLPSFGLPEPNPWLVAILSPVAWIPLESLLIATFSSTPGKLLFALRVQSESGSRLSQPRALRRAMQVWVYGLAGGIPVLSAFASWDAYRFTMEHGQARWDMACCSRVRAPSGSWWTYYAVGMTIVVFAVLSVLNAVSRNP